MCVIHLNFIFAEGGRYVLWTELWAPNSYIEDLTPDVTAFGDWA